MKVLGMSPHASSSMWAVYPVQRIDDCIGARSDKHCVSGVVDSL